MATKRMLVDASHPEETRIIVTSGNRLDEFDYEAANKRQLRGNIYLAKVTRVEPSLQAAFVEYGGNRHGFLAFSEIHPDYFQIPVADREALLREVARSVSADADDALNNAVQKPGDDPEGPGAGEQPLISDLEGEPSSEAEAAQEADAADATDVSEGNGDGERDDFENVEDDEEEDLLATPDEDEVETDDKELIERRRLARRYKIQEVIKRRQVLLVQVVKEERGNKGAALTTYLSLAGRYSVLMPNTARGGGISRKITSSADRKRLKQIAGDLSVPAGMGVILRTAGAARTKAEIKRDFEYLSRLWENVRQLTMQSSAPHLVYEEGSLIKRTIRDLYNKDISEVLVAGDEAYREAKDFMRLIMPSHAKNVKAYKEDQNLFSRFNVEDQLDSMFSPRVTLPSGGYLVINPTEALISIDVNSGRATREHNIEDTALQTNLEAAEEVARQLRLRDLAGLIVIDFIDMSERRSIRGVEKRMKDALKNERARVQVGRISHFGLLEMSRQRMRFGVLESTTQTCPTCEGTGLVRAVESLALMVVRAIEDHVVKRPGNSIQVRTPNEVALYILNSKRALLMELEARHQLTITITADAKLSNSQFAIDRGEDRVVQGESTRPAVGVSPPAIKETPETGEADSESRPQRKRRRRKPANEQSPGESVAEKTTKQDETGQTETSEAATEPGPDLNADDQPRKRRRRGRRGGRRNRRGQNEQSQETNQEANAEHLSATQDRSLPTEAGNSSADAPAGAKPETAGASSTDAETAPEGSSPDSGSSGAEESSPPPSEPQEPSEGKPKRKPARRRTRHAKKSPGDAQREQHSPASADAGDAKQAASASGGEPQSQPRAQKQTATAPLEATPAPQTSDNGAEQPAGQPEELPQEGVIVSTSSSEAKPKRKGWWSRG